MTPLSLSRARLVKLAKQVTADPKLRARDGKTFCNFSLAQALEAFQVPLDIFRDKHGNPKLANQMIDVFAAHPHFHPIAAYEDAQQLANAGLLVIAGVKLFGHGHVCFVCPADRMFFSSTYRKDVPFVANVGPEKYTGIVPMSRAFSLKNKPTLWYYEPKIGELHNA